MGTPIKPGTKNIRSLDLLFKMLWRTTHKPCYPANIAKTATTATAAFGGRTIKKKHNANKAVAVPAKPFTNPPAKAPSTIKKRYEALNVN